MKKYNIIIHAPDNIDYDKINKLHTEMIENYLNSLDLTVTEKMMVIDKIIENLKSRECRGIIT